MGNKEDWEELEKWQERRKEEQKEKFRVDFSEIGEKREYKGVNTIVKGMKIAGKTIKIGEIITIIIVIASVLLIFDLIISNINAKTNVKPEKTIENMYNTKIDLIYKDIDEKDLLATTKVNLGKNTVVIPYLPLVKDMDELIKVVKSTPILEVSKGKQSAYSGEKL